MAVTAVCDETLRLGERILDVLGAVHGENGRKLLVGELFVQLHALNLADKDLRVGRNLETCKFRNRLGLLSDDLRIQRTVDEDRLAGLLKFRVVQEVASHPAE